MPEAADLNTFELIWFKYEENLEPEQIAIIESNREKFYSIEKRVEYQLMSN